MIGFTWIFPIVVLVPTWFGHWGTFGYDPTILNCSILEVNGKSPKYFLFVSAFLVPCFTIIVCYTRIFCIVRQSKLKMSLHARTIEQSRERETRRRAEEWKVTKMVLIIFCSFLVCYLPITLVKVADRNVRYPGVHLLAYTLVYLSACLNPVIYGLTNQQFRDVGLKRQLHGFFMAELFVETRRNLAYKHTIARLCGFISAGCTRSGQCFVLKCRGGSALRTQKNITQDGDNRGHEHMNENGLKFKRPTTMTTSVSIQCPSFENLELLDIDAPTLKKATIETQELPIKVGNIGDPTKDTVQCKDPLPS